MHRLVVAVITGMTTLMDVTVGSRHILNVKNVHAAGGIKEVVVVAIVAQPVRTNQMMIPGLHLVRHVMPVNTRALVGKLVRHVVPANTRLAVVGRNVEYVMPVNTRPAGRRSVHGAPMVRYRLVKAHHRALHAPLANTIPLLLVKTAMQVNIRPLVRRHVRHVVSVNIRPVVRRNARHVLPANTNTKQANRDVTIATRVMVPRLVHQAKQVVGLVPKVRVLYQEAHARHVLRANTKTKLLKALVNYVLRVNI